MSTISDFATQVLAELGAPATAQNIDSIADWAAQEGGGGANNPLNTTLVTSGSTGAVNSAGVQNYASVTDGVQATAQTLQEGYPAIVAALQSGNGIVRTTSSAIESELSEWSGGGYTSISATGSTSAAVASTASSSGADQAVLTGWNIPGPLGIPGEIAEAIAGLWSNAGSLNDTASALTQIARGFTVLLHAFEWIFVPSNWVRIICFGGGLLFFLPGLYSLMRAAQGGSGDITLALGILLITVSGILFFIAFHNLPQDVDNLSTLLSWITASIQQGKPAASGVSTTADTVTT